MNCTICTDATCVLCTNLILDAPVENKYAGESDAKKVARLYFYHWINKRWFGWHRPQGWAITLAGPEAAEVGLIRDLLKWPAEKTIFVDLDPEGLRTAEKKWPGCRTFHGDVRDLLRDLKGPVGFAHLDFLGHLNPVVEESLYLVSRRLALFGTVGLTFMRGREHEKTPHWKEATAVSKLMGRRTHSTRRSKENELHISRMFGYLEVMRQIMKIPLTGAVFSEYQSTSPMSMWGVVHCPRNIKGPNRPEAALVRPIVDGEAAIRRYVSESEYERDQLASFLNVAPGSISAWRAHTTRGTYEGNGDGMSDRYTRRRKAK